MRRFLAIAFFLALCPAAKSGAAEPDAASGPLTLPQYSHTLDESLAAVQGLRQEQPRKAGEILSRLPPAWHVAADGRSFEVPTESIRVGLEAWQKEPQGPSLEPVLRHLETLRRQAAEYETARRDSLSRHVLLNNILARSEFRNIHGPTRWDRLRQQINDLLIRLLGKAFSSSAFPVLGNIIVYGLVAFAMVALAFWMYRSLREDARLEAIQFRGAPVSAKASPVWMTEARAAAARGDWRDAIHLAYWGGISFLELQGAWRPDVARTPREYLRLLPAASDQQPALRALTLRLEAVWYGMQLADAEGFQQTLAELERLGCPSN